MGALHALVMLVLAHGAASTLQDDPSTERSLVLTGRGEYDGFVFVHGRDGGLQEGRNELLWMTGVEGELSSTLGFEAAVELRKDFADDSRTRIFLDEAFADFAFETWELRAGRQIVSWGRSEFVSPMNVWERRDLTDFLDAEEEPIDGVRLDFYRGDWTFEGVWVPIFRPDTFPLSTANRWTFPALRRGLLDPSPFRLRLEKDRSLEPPENLRSSQLGLRATRRSSGMDWSASYYFGYDRTPTYLEQIDPMLDAATETVVVTLAPIHERVHVAGFDARRFFGSYGIAAEIAYTITSDADGTDPRIDDPYLQLVVGVERTFSRIAAGTHDLFVHVQYLLDRETPRRGASNQDSTAILIRHFYEHAVTLQLEYRFSTFTRVTSKNFVNLERGDYVTQLELAWQPRDAWTWTAGVDLMGGDDGSFFGLYDDNDRFRTSLTVYLPRWEPFSEEPASRRR